jgi:hypothetical protein
MFTVMDNFHVYLEREKFCNLGFVTKFSDTMD